MLENDAADLREQTVDRFQRLRESNAITVGHGLGDKIVDANRAFLDVLHAQHSDVTGGLPLSRVFTPADLGDGFEAFVTGTSSEYEVHRLDGTTGYIIAAGVDLEPDPGWLLVAVDITERKAAEEATQQLALRDPLTGLANRRLLLDRLTRSLARAARSGHLVGVLFCDLDRFKILNDTYGHAMGDRVLEIVARRLEDLSRETDTVARHGGDEFVVVIEDIDDERQVTRIAERLRSTLAQPMIIGDGELRVHCSVGALIVMPNASVDVDSLLERADAAMYLAKRGGGNQAVTMLSGSSKAPRPEEQRRMAQPGVADGDKPQSGDSESVAADLCVLDLEPSPDSVGVARHALEGWALQVGADSVIETAKLLVSELATNAVRHARTAYTLRAHWRPPYLRVEVIDFAPPRPRTTSRADQLGGWGYEFLDRLSHAWGIDDRGDSKATWFDVKEPADPATAEASPAPRDSSTAQSTP